jgi:hypothetical protein
MVPRAPRADFRLVDEIEIPCRPSTLVGRFDRQLQLIHVLPIILAAASRPLGLTVIPKDKKKYQLWLMSWPL